LTLRLPPPLVLAVALGTLALQFSGDLLRSLLALVLWIGTLVLVDRQSLRRLWLPRFWAFSIAIALGSGLLLGERDTVWLGLAISGKGLRAGVLMVVRGAYLFALASWGSRQLTGTGMRRLLRRIGLIRFGEALEVAFGLLPELATTLRRAGGEVSGGRGLRGVRPGHFYQTAVQVVAQTGLLAIRVASEKARPAVETPPPAPAASRILWRIALIGERGEGKTSTLQRLGERLREQGVTVGGILQPGVHEGDQRVGYGLRDVLTGEERPFATKGAQAGLGFTFDPAGWTWSRDALARGDEDSEVLLVDELGRLEARGEGHLPPLLALAPEGRARVWLCGVRAGCETEIAQRLGPWDRLQPLPAPGSAEEEELLQEVRRRAG